MDNLVTEFAIAHADNSVHKIKVLIPINGMDIGEALHMAADQALEGFRRQGAAPVPDFVPTEAEVLTEAPEVEADHAG